MRGKPATFVKCDLCGADDGWPQSRICAKCRSGRTRLKYVWTAEKDRLVREAWQSGTTKPRLSEAISYAVRQIGFPRHIVRFRAAALGLCHDTRRPWTAEERDYVEENAGRFSAAWIAKKLKRSRMGVISHMGYEGISRRVLEGYSLHDVSELTGVSFVTAQKWLRIGLLSAVRGRITETSLKALVFGHPELYALRKVNEGWYKALVFPRAACYRPLDRAKRHSAIVVPPAAMPVSSASEEVAEYQSRALA